MLGGWGRLLPRPLAAVQAQKISQPARRDICTCGWNGGDHLEKWACLPPGRVEFRRGMGRSEGATDGCRRFPRIL